MAIAKVLARGQVTLPKAVRQKAGVQPGDVVTLEVKGPGTVELKVLPRMRLEDTLERYRIEGPINWAADRAEAEAQEAEEVLRRMWLGG